MGTKTRMMSRLFAMVMAAILAGAMAIALGLSLGVSQASAGSGWPIGQLEKSKTVYMSYLGTKADASGKVTSVEHRFFSQLGPKVTKVKSTNKKVATVKAVNRYFCGITIDLKKPGKTKITYNRGGKRTINLIVKKYVNPIQSFTVGTTQLAPNFETEAIEYVGNGSRNVAAPVNSFTGRIKIKPKVGWKVSSIYTWSTSGKKKTIKNNSKVSKLDYIYLDMKNKKTGLVEHYYLRAAGTSYQSESDSLQAANL